MERLRKPFQGVGNIIRFNWHFYVWSLLLMLLLFIITMVTDGWYIIYIKFLLLAIILATVISLAVSFYVYDLSNLYSFNWLHSIAIHPAGTILNIHAGFDETSSLLKAKYPDAELIVFDFYDPQKHTEISIQRARNAYPSYPGTQAITTARLPVAASSVDTVYLLLAAHEIRNEKERIHFFTEIARVLKPAAKIIVTEHLRNLPNFLAYTIGFLHFHSGATWHRTFRLAGLHIRDQIKTTPFITTFILEKNGTAS